MALKIKHPKQVRAYRAHAQCVGTPAWAVRAQCTDSVGAEEQAPDTTAQRPPVRNALQRTHAPRHAYALQVWLLRGNHECAAINRIYGFYDVCKRRYSVKLWKTFQVMGHALCHVTHHVMHHAMCHAMRHVVHHANTPHTASFQLTDLNPNPNPNPIPAPNSLSLTPTLTLTLQPSNPEQELFNSLPLAAVVDSKIFCIHGGLSPDIESPDDLKRVARPVDVPDTGLLCDTLWSDPDRDITGWAENDRGVSYTFGADVVRRFLEKNDLDLIVRAHQVVKDGYEFFADRGLVTVFSAPNYCSEFDNCGAMMSVDENLQCNRLEWPTVGQQPVGYAAAQAEDVTAASNPTLRVLRCTSSESTACTCLHACAALPRPHASLRSGVHHAVCSKRGRSRLRLALPRTACLISCKIRPFLARATVRKEPAQPAPFFPWGG